MNIEAQAVYKFMAWAQANAPGIFQQEYLAFFDRLAQIDINSVDALIIEYKRTHQPIAESGFYWESPAPVRDWEIKNCN